MKKTRIKYLKTLAFVMMCIVALLLAGFMLTKARTYSEMENRNLQTAPELTWTAVTSGRFESRFEDYVEDQFPLRDLWIRLKSGVDRLLGRTEANNVFLADDGYLIRNFVEPSEERIMQNANAIQSFANAHGELHHYMLLVPSALTVYADKLPANAIVGDENGYMDRMKHALQGGSVQFIDVRADFMSAGEQLYYRTDHHWTTRAAYRAFLQFASAAGLEDGGNTSYTPLIVSDSFSGTLTGSSGFRLNQIDEIEVYVPQESVSYVVSYAGQAGKYPSFYQSEKLKLRDQYTLFFGGNHPLVKIETGSQSKRVLLVLKDSYANCFVPFLAQDFKKIIMVDPRYYTEELETLLASEGISDVLYLYNAATLSSDTSLRDDLMA